MSDERSGINGLITFLSGAVIGAGIALLFAPQSGRETRKKIKQNFVKIGEEAKEGYERISEETHDALEAVKKASEKAVFQVKSMIEGAKEGFKKEMPGDDHAAEKKKGAKA